jgi:putative transposase
VWNTGLVQRRMYRQDHKWINYHQQAKEMADAKSDPEFAWLADAPSHCLQQTLRDLDRACRSRGTWAINFRAQSKWSPAFRFPKGSKMPVRKLSKRWGSVRIPKFGQVTFRRSRDLGGQIRSATITREGVHGDWYISFLIEDGILTGAVDLAKPAVGIDRGVVTALALSDGRMLDQVFTTPAEQVSIANLQRKAARQQGPRVPGVRGRAGRRKPSKRWSATQARITKKLAKQRRRRDDFTAKAARVLTAQHSMIVLEKLQVANMTKAPAAKPDPEQPGAYRPNNAAAKAGLNRAILAKGWGKFALALHHKARYTGTEIVLVPAAYTSQRCHQCGHTAKENRESQAVFRCVRCGHTANADTNAALNILAAGQAVTGRPKKPGRQPRIAA